MPEDAGAILTRTSSLWIAGVSGVSRVQSSNNAGSGCNPCEIGGVSEVANPGARTMADTPDTSDLLAGYQRKPAPMLGCTPDTCDTSQNYKGARNVAR
jgi:hypothetical protein